MTKARDIADFKFENITDTGTEGTKIASGTTAQRGSAAGQLRFNTTTNVAEYYNGSEFKIVETPPSITSLSKTLIDSNSGTTSSINVLGSFFASGASVLLIPNSGSNITPSSTTFNNSGSITIVVTDSDFANANEPYSVKVTNPSGTESLLSNAINVDTTVAWSTSAGSLGSLAHGATGNHYTLSATDADNDAITYSIQSGSLPTGLSLSSSTGVISGNLGTQSSVTTYTFTVRASTANANVDRQFSIIANPPPIDIHFLVVAGGGCGGHGLYHGGGGGAGGFRTSYGTSGRGASAESVLQAPQGEQLTITVGAGASGTSGGSDVQQNGSNSSISNSNITDIISLGGGASGAYSNSQRQDSNDTDNIAPSGGCGGGGASSGAVERVGGAGTAGQGYDGGTAVDGSGGPHYGAGGGGGANGFGGNGNTSTGGSGGSGQSSTIKGSSITLAGGGGGSTYNGGSPGGGGSGGGGSGSTGGGGSGSANTGGGGGGSERGASSGASGGSGRVILRVATSDYTGTYTGSPSISTSGSDTILDFTGTGSYTA